jgi:hypothetical protein
MFPTLLLSGLFALAPAKPDVPATEQAARLVAQLADPSFRVREQAAKELVALGGPAIEALRKGLQHPDAEVADRCRKLIPQALDLHLREQIDVFLAKPNGPIPEDLPGIGRWLKSVGDSPESRQLYARMLREQRGILVEFEQDRSKAPARFRAFMQEIYNRSRAVSGEIRKDLITYSELLLFFFASGDPDLRHDSANGPTTTSYVQSSAILNSTLVQGMLTGDTSSDATKKLFLCWLEREKHATLLRRGFGLAGQTELREAAPIALKAITDKGTIASTRGAILMAAAKLFGKEHLKDLTVLMSDQTLLVKSTNVNGQSTSAELRDVALGVALQASGQKPADYGFERFPATPPSPTGYVSPMIYALTDQQRVAAFEKWKQWTDQKRE